MSQKLGQKLRVTGGLGWGRMGTENKIKDNSIRNNDVGGEFSGLVRLKQLYQGNIGLFGGLEIDSSISGLSYQLEVSSDSYIYDEPYINEMPKTNINYGIKYEISNNLNLSTFYNYGKQVGLKFDFSASPLVTSAGDYLENVSEPFYSIPLESNAKREDEFWKELILSLEKEKISTIAYKSAEKDIFIVIENNYYSTHTQAIGKTLRALSKHVPLSKMYFNIILSEYGVPITEVSFNRFDLEYIVDAPNAELLSSKIAQIKTSQS